MGLTQKLGTIPLAIQTDSSNNVGIGGAANASYKLAVTGASLFSSTIIMNGTAAQILQTTANSVSGDNVAVLYNSNANSYGLYIGAGSGTNHALYCTDSTRTKDLFKVQGNGNIGIGTGTPVSLGASYTTLEIKGQSGLYGGAIQMTSADGTNKGRVYVANDTFWIGTQNSLPLGFITADTERMRITSGGVVLIGTTSVNGISGAGSLQVGKEIISSGSSAFLGFQNRVSSNFFGWYGNTNAILYNDAVGNIVSINASSGAYTATSDIRLKENIKDSENALDKLIQVKVKSYDWISNKNHESFGLIAQELYEILPEYTYKPEIEEENWGIAKAELVPMLIKAIQELAAEVELLKNK